jgi:hypothetical protein
MPSDQQIEIYRQHRTAQDKYGYFLLAAVGAAIAFAVNQTQGAKLAWSQLPLACAVACWALSFFFGCRHLTYVESALFANFGLLTVIDGEDPRIGTHPQLMAVASDAIREAIELKSMRASRFARWQFRFLVLGTVFYLAWHVLGMWLRS